MLFVPLPHPPHQGNDDAPWRVVIRNNDGRPVGAGVLITPTEVVTCAHVVASALGKQRFTERPSEPVSFSFLTAPAPTPVLSATVVEDGWHVDREFATADVAILRFEGPLPRGVAPATLTRWRDSPHSAVRLFGHPRGMITGVWAEAQPRGSSHTGWIQLDGLTVWPVQSGFSGAGVELKQARKVCGIAASALNPELRISYAIPMELIALLWPPLTKLLGPAVATPLLPSAPPELISELDRILRGLRSLQSMVSVREVVQEIASVLGPLRQAPEPEPGRQDPVGLLIAMCQLNGGALRELLKLLERRGETAAMLARLSHVVHQLDPEPLLQPRERERLFELLESISAEQLAEAARYATDGGNPVGDWSSVAELVGQLEARACRPRAVPDLLKFIDHVAHTHQSVTLDLHHLIWGELSQHVETVIDRSLCHATGVWLQEASFSLMVQLEPAESADVPRFHCRLYVWRKNAKQPYRKVDAAEPLTESEVQEQIHRLLRTETALTSGEDDVPIEFFLPRPLLGLAVDQWPLPDFPVALGNRHVVVVRSLDRIREPQQHPAWRRTSRTVETALLQPEMLHWHDDVDPVEGGQLYNHLIDNPHLIGIVIGHPPESSAADRRDPFQPAIAAGLPLLIWVRNSRSLALLRTELEHLLAGQTAELPRKIRQVRVRAAATGPAAAHLGRYLVVMWDPADLRGQALADQMRFTAPASGSG